jgi:HEAT repeat protein
LALSIALVWFAALMVEALAIVLVYRPSFAGSYELLALFGYALPCAIALLTPIALCAGAAACPTAVARAFRSAILVLALFALGYALTSGRRILPYRWPFTLALTIAGAWLASRRVNISRIPTALWLLMAFGFWLLDLLLLPRLYPALHLAFAALFFLALVPPALRTRPRTRFTLALGTLSLLVAPLAWARLRSFDNLRLILFEHAPILGKAITATGALGTHLAPTAEGAAEPTTVRATSQFDFRGRDILLITVDALRADHVGAYGYARATTPEIDALAATGLRFEYAYCATPHTSYSITSLMTGKYMRPLLLANLGADSDTLASVLRNYDYQTAAFYPPAVFFVDEARFAPFQTRKLDFEYAKVEFANPELRAAQVRTYLESAPKNKPVFLWVHYFEPHEPYEPHPEQGAPFGARAVDAYDGEIRAVDAGIGKLTRLFAELRGAEHVTILSADHGEEFDEHGGRYHGTTVYEEQVRVPLIVKAPGIVPQIAPGPVQTVDIMPTVLAALSVPISPRVRGTDLSLRRTSNGFAFAESEDQALLAEGRTRLVCNRALGACRMFDLAVDAGQRAGAEAPDDARKRLSILERSHGGFEGAAGDALPEALRQALSGNRDSAAEVAELLDDARVDIRRQAAHALMRLRVPDTLSALARARERDEDAHVRNLCAVALARLDRTVLDHALLADQDVGAWAALALAERGDRAGESELLAFLARTQDLLLSRELLRALATIKSTSAVPMLSARLASDVRLRPDIARTLEAIGDARAKTAIVDALREERYMHARLPEAKAAIALGATRSELEPILRAFAGMPEPFPGLLDLVALQPWAQSPPATVAGSRVYLFEPAATISIGTTVIPTTRFDQGAYANADGAGKIESLGKRVWVVPLRGEIPPPPPKVEN